MRRRLVLTIAGAVAAAVAVVGLGTLALTRIDARLRNEQDLGRRLNELAQVVGDFPVRADRVTQRLEGTLDVDRVVLVQLDDPPDILEPADVERLRAGETVTRRDRDTAYAAAPLPRSAGRIPVRALLASDSIDPDVGAAGRWFVVVGAATVVLGGLVAVRMARSLAGPLGAAEQATRRIADGDLSARVPEPPSDGDELGRLVRSINTMAASLERSQRTEREFLLSISHDLRTPLTSISGWAEALADEAAPDPAAAGTTILSEAHRLDRLVRDLLDLARLRARAFTLDLRPVDLRDVAVGAAEGLRPELDDAGVALALDLPDEPVLVNGDPDRLAQIAGNLVENAGRHADGHVRISVGVGGVDGADALLAVDDDGPGIPPGERGRIFDRLYSTARPAARPGTGTGLGLAIVRELAQAMGGTATATVPRPPGSAPETASEGVAAPSAPTDHDGPTASAAVPPPPGSAPEPASEGATATGPTAPFGVSPAIAPGGGGEGARLVVRLPRLP
jgi:two-component system, OmpR family, sensor kinase